MVKRISSKNILIISIDNRSYEFQRIVFQRNEDFDVVYFCNRVV
jgi:hypothetical protein